MQQKVEPLVTFIKQQSQALLKTRVISPTQRNALLDKIDKINKKNVKRFTQRILLIQTLLNSSIEHILHDKRSGFTREEIHYTKLLDLLAPLKRSDLKLDDIHNNLIAASQNQWDYTIDQAISDITDAA